VPIRRCRLYAGAIFSMPRQRKRASEAGGRRGRLLLCWLPAPVVLASCLAVSALVPQALLQGGVHEGPAQVASKARVVGAAVPPPQARRHRSPGGVQREGPPGGGAAASAAILLLQQHPQWLALSARRAIAGRAVHWRRGPRVRAAAITPSLDPPLNGDLAVSLVPPPLGEPVVPQLRRWQATQPARRVEVPPALRLAHAEAASNVTKGLKLGLEKATVVLPMGLGDGIVGSRVLAEAWKTGRNPKQPFRALVLMTEAMLQQAEVQYRQLAGDGLWAIRIEPGFAGTDQVARALNTCRGLIAIGTYAEAHSFTMAMRRNRMSMIDLVIFEMANAALGGDQSAKDAVFNWQERYKQQVFRSVYISTKSLEPNPVQGLQRATMMVPGTPPYRVVCEQGGPCGPEVFSLPAPNARQQGLTVPVRIVPLGAKGLEDLSGLAQEVALLSISLGIPLVEVALAGGAETASTAAAVDAALRAASGGACRATLVGEADGSANALLIADAAADPTGTMHVLGRLAFRSDGKEVVHLLVPGSSGIAVAGWRALAEHDAEVEAALLKAAVELGRLGRDLTWDDLPAYLQDIVAFTGKQGEGHRAVVARLVNAVVNETADEWDVWYGRLLAFRKDHPDEVSVPLTATMHGQPLGQWVSRQFLEWRWGSLSAEKRQRLMDHGVSFSEEKDRFFAEGLEEFARHLDEQDGDPYVPMGHFTECGFALGAWALAQRAAWRRGRLTAEQQHLLDAVGFGPMAHPANPELRNVTLEIEGRLRDAQGLNIRAREQCFRSLVLKHHPSRSRTSTAEAATQFLAGYRDWFLTPPMPPPQVSEGPI